jgi:hypothetical protein
MTTTTRSTGSVVKLAGQAEDHLSRLRSRQQGLLTRSGQGCELAIIGEPVNRALEVDL